MENLTTLQAVASRVNSDAVAAGQPNPGYTAYLAEGNDIGGIDVGFLVKSRVTVIDVTQVGKDATYIDPNTGGWLFQLLLPVLIAIGGLCTLCFSSTTSSAYARQASASADSSVRFCSKSASPRMSRRPMRINSAW